MIVKESDIRAKIRRLLTEDFKFYDGQKSRVSDVNSTEESGCVVFDLTSKPVASNILHRLTKDSHSSYAAWKIVFENIFISNMNGAVDRNKSNSNNVFYDVEWDSTLYSIKSTLGEGRTNNSFQTKAYGGNPTFTKSFIEGFDPDQKNKDTNHNEKQYKRYGIIVATRIENELIWQIVGTPRLGFEIFDKYKDLLQTQTQQNILGALSSGKNQQFVITHFFGTGYKDVLKVKLAPKIFSDENNPLFENNPLLEKIYDKIDELQYSVEINQNKLRDVESLTKIENDINTLMKFINSTMTP